METSEGRKQVRVETSERRGQVLVETSERQGCVRHGNVDTKHSTQVGGTGAGRREEDRKH